MGARADADAAGARRERSHRRRTRREARSACRQGARTIGSGEYQRHARPRLAQSQFQRERGSHQGGRCRRQLAIQPAAESQCAAVRGLRRSRGGAAGRGSARYRARHHRRSAQSGRVAGVAGLSGPPHRRRHAGQQRRAAQERAARGGRVHRTLQERARYRTRCTECADHACERARATGAGAAQLGGGARRVGACGRRAQGARADDGGAVIRKLLGYGIILLIIVSLAAFIVWRSLSTMGEQAKGQRPDKLLVVELVAARTQPMPIALQAVYFTEGQTVQKGQRLFRIDPAQYESALAGARAAWESAQAQAERLAPLAGKEFVTAQEYENARASEGQLKAMLRQAEINLAYTDIRAPIAGRTGSLGVKSGNLVAPNDTAALVVINQMQPILVQYSLPQQRLPELRRYSAARSIRVFITLEDGSGDLGEGDLVFIDNIVNTETGTVLLKARLRNEREQRWPGQYVGVRTQFAMQRDALVVPLTAVQTGQNGNYVYVVEQGGAAVRQVEVDRQVGDLAVIAHCLAADEQVVMRAPRFLFFGVF